MIVLQVFIWSQTAEILLVPDYKALNLSQTVEILPFPESQTNRNPEIFKNIF